MSHIMDGGPSRYEEPEPEIEAINAALIGRAAGAQKEIASDINHLDATVAGDPFVSSSIGKEVINIPPVSNMPNSDTSGNDSCYLGDVISRSQSEGSLLAAASTTREAAASTSNSTREGPTNVSADSDQKPPRPSSRSNADGVQTMRGEVIALPSSEVGGVDNSSTQESTSIQIEDNWSTAGGAAASRDPSEVGSSHHSSASPKIVLSSSSLSGEKRCSPDKSILDLLDEDEKSIKFNKDGEGDAKPYSHVSAAHEILNSFIALNPSPDRGDGCATTATPTAFRSQSDFVSIGNRGDGDSRKASSEVNAKYVRKNSLHVITSTSSRDLKTPSNNSTSESTNKYHQPNDTSSPGSPGKIYDKKKLNERLRQRLAERHLKIRTNSDKSPDKLITSSQAKYKAHKRPASSAGEYFPRERLDSTTKAAYDTFMKYGISPTGAFPDTVSFDFEENESQPSLTRRSFRKSSSETGISPPVRPARANMHRKVPPPHGIGILQPDGVVFDDALLLRLARQARYSKLRGDLATVGTSTATGGTERRFNTVKIHVYDLLQKDALVEMPYFNCNFPVGQCFNVMNNAANCLGTGAYHVGVEVNGIEYAFGANNIMGMSGVFTCPPKQSPGYEYRETLDFGNVYTSRKTWIRIPKENKLGRSISNALGVSGDSLDEADLNKMNTSTVSTADYTFRQLESFADGNTVIHSMAKEYMGTDYDLLRKNCCTFAHDVCLRLGVKEEDIPSWFHNAAKAGADAEDAITNAEQTVKNMFDCADMEGNPGDIECYNHGFEIIADMKNGSSKLKVVESPSVNRHATTRQPLLDEDHSEFWETLSCTY